MTAEELRIAKESKMILTLVASATMDLDLLVVKAVLASGSEVASLDSRLSATLGEVRQALVAELGSTTPLTLLTVSGGLLDGQLDSETLTDLLGVAPSEAGGV